MEQKTKTAVCPCCGGTLQVQGQALFKEHHERLWKEKIAECGIIEGKDRISFGDLFYEKQGTTWLTYKPYYRTANKPDALVQWERSNPIPKIGLNEFVHQLYERVSALEAEAAQKGGQQ